MFINSTTTYTVEKFLSFHRMANSGTWLTVEHKDYEEMIDAQRKSDEVYIHIHWQTEGIHIVRETGLKIEFNEVLVKDKHLPGYPAWQMSQLLPSKQFCEAWIGENPLVGLFEELPEEFSKATKDCNWLAPNWYPVSLDGDVYEYIHVPTTAGSGGIDTLCHRISEFTELEGSSIELIKETRFGIAKPGLPRGLVFLNSEQVLEWVRRTTKIDDSWSEVYARCDLEKRAKNFISLHSQEVTQ